MKVVIDIPEEIYNTIMDDQMLSREQLAVLQQRIYNKHIVVHDPQKEATTKIVIEIPTEWYDFLKSHEANIRANLKYCRELTSDIAILDGQPLPKGHGRLKDADALLTNDTRLIEKHDKKRFTVVLAEDIDAAPTIIEADKEGAKNES